MVNACFYRFFFFLICMLFLCINLNQKTMKRKFLALAFFGAMVFGFSLTAEGGSGGPCETYSQPCPGGGGWTGIVCEPSDWLMWNSIYCTEPDFDD